MELLTFFLVIYFMFGFGMALAGIYRNGPSLAKSIFAFLLRLLAWPFALGVLVETSRREVKNED